MAIVVLMLMLAIVSYVFLYGPEVLLHAIVSLYAIVCLPVIANTPCNVAIIIECVIGAAVAALIFALESVRDSHCF